MPLQRARLRQLLLELGFRAAQTDHEVFLLEVDGKRAARTKLSRGSSHRTLDEPLVAEIARQLHVSRQFLYQLVRSEKTPDDYFAELRRQGIID